MSASKERVQWMARKLIDLYSTADTVAHSVRAALEKCVREPAGELADTLRALAVDEGNQELSEKDRQEFRRMANVLGEIYGQVDAIVERVKGLVQGEVDYIVIKAMPYFRRWAAHRGVTLADVLPAEVDAIGDEDED
jgi:hypothetical protein